MRNSTPALTVLLTAGVIAAGCAHSSPALGAPGGALAEEPAVAQASPIPGTEDPDRAGAEIDVDEESEQDSPSAIEQFMDSPQSKPLPEELPDPDAEYTINPESKERFLFLNEVGQLLAPEVLWLPSEEGDEVAPLFDAVGEEAKSNYVRGAFLGQSGFGARAAEYYVEAVDRDPENLYLKNRAAEALLAQNDLPRAERYLLEVLEADSSNYRAMLLMASLAEYRNRKAEARDWYQKALEVKPRNLSALSNLARMAYYDDKDLERTKELCELILTTGRRSQPEYLNGLLWNAEAHALTGDVSTAADLYRQLVNYRPSLIGRLSDMGIRLVRMGRGDEAMDLFRQGVVMAPTVDSVRMQWESLIREREGDDAVRAAYEDLSSEFPLDLRLQELFADYLKRTADVDALIEQRNRMLEVEPRHIPSLLSLARIAWTNDRREEASEYFERAISAGPDNPSTYRDVAITYLEAGNLTRAEELLTEAFAMDPENPDTLVALAALAEKMENPEQTEQFLRSALDASPANERILRLLGDFLRRQGKTDRAAEVYEQVLAASPDDLPTMIDVASLYYELQDDAALDRLQDQAAKALGDPLVFYINYGVLAMDAADFDRARWSFERALRIAPGDLSTRSTLADAYLHLGEPEYAEKALTDGREYVPADGVASYHFRLLGLYEDMGLPEKALEQAEKLVDMDSNDISFQGLYLTCLVRAGRSEKASDELNDFVRTFAPENPVETQRVRADVLYERGEVERALGVMRGLHRENPDDPQTEFTLAHLYAEAGQPDLAERHYRNLIESLDGRNEYRGLYIRSLNNLAFTFGEAGMKLNEALELVERALEFDPHADYILDTKGRLHFHLKEYQEAERWLREADRRSFGDPEIKGHLGDLYRELNEPSTSRRFYEQALELDPDNAAIRTRFDLLLNEFEPSAVTQAETPGGQPSAAP